MLYMRLGFPSTPVVAASFSYACTCAVADLCEVVTAADKDVHMIFDIPCEVRSREMCSLLSSSPWFRKKTRVLLLAGKETESKK